MLGAMKTFNPYGLTLSEALEVSLYSEWPVCRRTFLALNSSDNNRDDAGCLLTNLARCTGLRLVRLANGAIPLAASIFSPGNLLAFEGDVVETHLTTLWPDAKEIWCFIIKSFDRGASALVVVRKINWSTERCRHNLPELGPGPRAAEPFQAPDSTSLARLATAVGASDAKPCAIMTAI